MKLNAKDRPKIIGLAFGILGVIVYMVFAVVTRLASYAPLPTTAPPPANNASMQTNPVPTPTPTNPTARNNNGAQGPILNPPIDDLDPDQAIQPSSDKFKPATPSKIEHPDNPFTPAAKPNPSAGPPGKAVTPGNPGASPAGTVPVKLGPGAAQPAVAIILPALELKGVIPGDKAIAVFSINGETVNLQAGEAIDANIKLAKITEEGVTVKIGKKYIRMAIGHFLSGVPGSPQSLPFKPKQEGQNSITDAVKDNLSRANH